MAALLGAQLVITLVAISVIQKVGPYFSFARWLLCSTGLVRYLYPTDSELKELANIPKEKSKNRKNAKIQTNGKTTTDTFHIPRSLDIKLDSVKITNLDVIHIRYYTEYQWLVDFSVYTFGVYVTTELYQFWFPLKNEMNLSMVWCFLVILFAVKLLFSLTIQYFKGTESVGERSTCIVMGFVYLLISMMVLIVDENMLEIGLEDAYVSFNKSASTFLHKQGLATTGPASKIVLKFIMAVWCGILGALFTFPGFRMAKMHWVLLKYFQDNKFKQLFLNVTFALPFILVIFWIKPVSRDYLTVRIFSGRSEPLMTEDSFESLRLIAIVVTMCLKLTLMPWYLQAYLDMAHHRLERQKKEAGRITNKELQKQIAAVFYYLCIVTVQYVAPIVLCVFFTFMYKTLGEYQWTGHYLKYQTSPNDTLPSNSTPAGYFQTEENGKSILESAAEFHLTIESLKEVFPYIVFRGLFGFATWWCCFLYFATTSFGLIYQSYFSNF
ncbi:transmembrane protein 161B [Diorhabda sublineata]|uniref:transmembrane protein 161B n=1 Tax=Diorhabda sublineata TaxID=1163346 RepID=UPI0024E05AF1|nr:transmembrane protein 161B [Diorhabda sublineata]